MHILKHVMCQEKNAILLMNFSLVQQTFRIPALSKMQPRFVH